VAIGNWVIDANGARSTQPSHAGLVKATRIIFLGSSMVNGDTHVKNNETISAYVEDEDVDALNFGTMMYSDVLNGPMLALLQT
jgi:uncharacterized glyoxalase superfamily protein PhnB